MYTYKSFFHNCMYYRRRDKARLEMNRIFGKVIQKRRASQSGGHEVDVLDTLLHETYK